MFAVGRLTRIDPSSSLPSLPSRSEGRTRDAEEFPELLSRPPSMRVVAIRQAQRPAFSCIAPQDQEAEGVCTAEDSTLPGINDRVGPGENSRDGGLVFDDWREPQNLCHGGVILALFIVLSLRTHATFFEGLCFL
jgi:hypothetical protein